MGWRSLSFGRSDAFDAIGYFSRQESRLRRNGWRLVKSRCCCKVVVLRHGGNGNLVRNKESSNSVDVEFAAVTEHFDCAEDFLAGLDTSRDEWQAGSPWIFRGQNDATWHLIPSLYRAFRDNPQYLPSYEFLLIDNFVLKTNMIDLEIPSNTMNYASTKIGDQYVTIRSHPFAESAATSRRMLHYDYTHAVFALAQHAGLPTRLLDFSYNPFIAAFFACEMTRLFRTLGISIDDYALTMLDIEEAYLKSRQEGIHALETAVQKFGGRRENLPKNMAVWAVSINALHRRTRLGVKQYPRSEILNLRAQEGVFVFRDDLRDDDNSDELDLRYPSFTDDLKKLIPTGDIRKLTLPWSQGDALGTLLPRKSAGRNHVLPSYESVAESVVEELDQYYDAD